MFPASQSSNHGQNPSGINLNIDDVASPFRGLGFGTDGTFRQGATAYDGNSIASSTRRRSNYSQLFQSQETSDMSQFGETSTASGNAVAGHDRVLGSFPYSTTFGENYASDVQNRGQGSLKGPMGYENWYSNSRTPQNFGAGTSTQPPSPMPGFVDQFTSNGFLRPDFRFRPMEQYTFGNDRFRGITNTGLCSDYSRWNQQEAGPGSGLKRVQEILRWGDYELKERVISVLKGCIFQVMTDKQTSFLFSSLIDECGDEQLNSIVGHLFSESELFINAAFCHPGANSIFKLIVKLKKSHDHAFTMTQILSTRFLDIVTHPIARNVIKQCLYIFGTEPRKVLCEKAIDHFKFLATHEVGCISLNDCVNMISGENKVILLDKIAEVSDYLSNDPFGNFVVQNLLMLRDMRVNNKILKCLEGQFVNLSQKKGGSHVVERCMDSCSLGLRYVVEEIVKTRKAPVRLARDPFGNYIIQKALKETKESAFGVLHDSLVECLLPHCRELNLTIGGRNIINLLE